MHSPSIEAQAVKASQVPIKISISFQKISPIHSRSVTRKETKEMVTFGQQA
jgi:hypothetical protein